MDPGGFEALGEEGGVGGIAEGGDDIGVDQGMKVGREDGDAPRGEDGAVVVPAGGVVLESGLEGAVPEGAEGDAAEAEEVGFGDQPEGAVRVDGGDGKAEVGGVGSVLDGLFEGDLVGGAGVVVAFVIAGVGLEPEGGVRRELPLGGLAGDPVMAGGGDPKAESGAVVEQPGFEVPRFLEVAVADGDEVGFAVVGAAVFGATPGEGFGDGASGGRADFGVGAEVALIDDEAGWGGEESGLAGGGDRVGEVAGGVGGEAEDHVAVGASQFERGGEGEAGGREEEREGGEERGEGGGMHGGEWGRVGAMGGVRRW